MAVDGVMLNSAGEGEKGMRKLQSTTEEECIPEAPRSSEGNNVNRINGWHEKKKNRKQNNISSLWVLCVFHLYSGTGVTAKHLVLAYFSGHCMPRLSPLAFLFDGYEAIKVFGNHPYGKTLCGDTVQRD